MFTITNQLFGRVSARAARTITSIPGSFVRFFHIPAAHRAPPENPPVLRRELKPRSFRERCNFGADLLALPRFGRAMLCLTGLAAMLTSMALAQGTQILPFKLESTGWYIQAGMMVNPTVGNHVFTDPPAGPGLWCTPALMTNSAEWVAARDYPLCPDSQGVLQRTRHDSAPHANDLVPSHPWEFDITCAVPYPIGAEVTRIAGVRAHPGLDHQDQYAALVGAYRGTAPGPSLAPRYVMIHCSIGRHFATPGGGPTNPPPQGSSPMVGGGSLRPPSGQPSFPNQNYPAGELLTSVDPVAGRLLLLLVVEGVSPTNFSNVYLRDGAAGPMLIDLRPLMQMRRLDANALAFAIPDMVIPPNVVQVMASGNAYLEAITTAHPDGRLVGALTVMPTAASYQVQLQPGWNVIANQLSRGSNTLAEVLPVMPTGSVFYKWNAASQTYSSSTFDPELGGWDNPSLSLAPGEGGFVLNVDVLPVSTSFTGEPITSQLPLNLPPGQLTLVAAQTPTPTTYEQIVGLPPSEGTVLYRYDSALRGDPRNLSEWQPYAFSSGQWTPATPTISVGEPVFIQIARPDAGPSFILQPQSQVVAVGSDVTFLAQVAGTPPFYWQWYFNGAAISGATNPAISLLNVQSAHFGDYSVTVSNSTASVTSSIARLSVNNPPVFEPIAPIRIHQGEALWQVIAASDLDGNHLTYQFNAGELPGANLDPATGLLTWDSAAAAVNTTNTVTVDVADDGQPVLHAQLSVPIVVSAPLRIQTQVGGGGGVWLTWNSIPGRTYVVQSSTNLTQARMDWPYQAVVLAESESMTWPPLASSLASSALYSVHATVPLTLRPIDQFRDDITMVSGLDLLRILMDLNRRKDFDYASHGGVPGPDSPWLWERIQAIMDELESRGWHFTPGSDTCTDPTRRTWYVR